MRLIANPGLAEEQRFEVQGRPVSIGRTQDNDVFVLHKSLSRRHARLEPQGDGFVLVDLQSKNGTFVSGKRVTRQVIREGDTFVCGEVTFQLLQEVQPLAVNGPPPALVRELQTQFSLPSMAELLDEGAPKPGSALKMKPLQGQGSAQDKLQILLKVSQLLSSPGTIDELLERILALVFQILEVHRAAILLSDKDTGELRPRVVKASTGEVPDSPVYSQHIVNYVRDHSVAALFSDARGDPRLDTSQSVFLQSICASMCVPLKPKDELLGVLYVDNLSTANHFTEADLEFLTAFANQAAIAIENSILYRRIEEEAVLRNTYLRFFPPATIKKLQASRSATLEVIETEVTALFSDISGFTALSSTLAPSQVVDLLNDYFPAMADIVFRHEGTLEKYIGDALMAVWGAPFSHPDDADRAIRVAVEMQRALAALNERWRAQGRVELQIHVGINTGRVAAGNIGSEKYLQYATIGDATNVASRVCNVAKPGEIVIASATLGQWRDRRWTVEELPPVLVKGKDAPLVLYRLDWDTGGPEASSTGVFDLP